jgi:hypothetical protein
MTHRRVGGKNQIMKRRISSLIAICILDQRSVKS